MSADGSGGARPARDAGMTVNAVGRVVQVEPPRSLWPSGIAVRRGLEVMVGGSAVRLWVVGKDTMAALALAMNLGDTVLVEGEVVWANWDAGLSEMTVMLRDAVMLKRAGELDEK